MTVLKLKKILQEKNSSDANSVAHLTLTHKALSDVSCLSEFKNLGRLDLGFNNLNSLEGLKLCVNLKWLSVVQNKLHSLNGIEGLIKLTVFNAGKNKLRSMDGLKSLVSLRALILNDNEISSVGKLDQMKELNTLVLSRNPINSLGDSLIKLKSITKLSLSNCHLQTIDSSLKSCTELKELRLAHNEIRTLPNDFAHFTKLQNLDLGNNLITKWSNLKELSSLVNLRNLNLQGNPIAEKENLVKKVKQLLLNLHIFNAKPTEKTLRKEIDSSSSEKGYESPLEGATKFNQELRNKNSRKAQPVYEAVDSHLKDEDLASKKTKKRPQDDKADVDVSISEKTVKKLKKSLQNESGNTPSDAITLKFNPDEAKKLQQKKLSASKLNAKASYVNADSDMKDKKSRKAIAGGNFSVIDNPETPFSDLFLAGMPEIPIETDGKMLDHTKVDSAKKDQKSRKVNKGYKFKGMDYSDTPVEDVLFASCGPEIPSKAVDKNSVYGTFKHVDKDSGAASITIYKRKKHLVNVDPATLSQVEIGLGRASAWV